MTSLIVEPIRVQIPFPSVRDGHTRPGLLSPLPPFPYSLLRKRIKLFDQSVSNRSYINIYGKKAESRH